MSAKMRPFYFLNSAPSGSSSRQTWHAAIVSGWENRNEMREREGFNPEAGLDSFVEPLNCVFVGK
jgi:phage portal protein BeeE